MARRHEVHNRGRGLDTTHGSLTDTSGNVLPRHNPEVGIIRGAPCPPRTGGGHGCHGLEQLSDLQRRLVVGAHCPPWTTRRRRAVAQRDHRRYSVAAPGPPAAPDRTCSMTGKPVRARSSGNTATAAIEIRRGCPVQNECARSLPIRPRWGSAHPRPALTEVSAPLTVRELLVVRSAFSDWIRIGRKGHAQMTCGWGSYTTLRVRRLISA